MDRKKELAMSAHPSCLVVYCNSIEANSCFKDVTLQYGKLHVALYSSPYIATVFQTNFKIGRIEVAFETFIRALNLQTGT